MDSVSIIIPVLNEASTLAEVLQRVCDAPLPAGMRRDIIIVDNGSTDGSVRIAENFARTFVGQPGDKARFVSCEKRGKGNALQEGFQHADGDIILIQDGDLEYDMNDYPSLLQPILQGKTKFVLGSRHLSAGNWKIRKFGNGSMLANCLNVGGLFFHSFFNTVYGVKLTDPTTMYKVFTRDSIRHLRFQAGRFDFDYELLGKLIRSGNVPLEVPVSYQARDFSEGKKIRIFADPFTWVYAILRFRFCRL